MEEPKRMIFTKEDRTRECCTCTAWKRDGKDGICKAKAPAPVILFKGAKFQLVEPRKEADDWCREWEAKD